MTALTPWFRALKLRCTTAQQQLLRSRRTAAARRPLCYSVSPARGAPVAAAPSIAQTDAATAVSSGNTSALALFWEGGAVELPLEAGGSSLRRAS